MKKIIYYILFLSIVLISCSSKNITKCDNCIYVNISKDLNVEITIPLLNQDSACFLFPQTIPGIYNKLNTVNLNNFKALDSLGNVLRISYSNDSSICIHNVYMLRKITYDIIPSDITTKNILAEGIIKTKKLLVINNQRIIGYFQEQINNKYILNINVEDSLHCISHFNLTKNLKEITFSNYHELIVSPFVFSTQIDTLTEMINTVKVGISTIAPLKSVKSKDILKIIKPTIKAVFKEIEFILPLNYNLVFIFNDSINMNINSTTALEHNNSSIYIYFSEPNLSKTSDSLLFCEKIKGFVSHELLHLFVPIKYNDDQLTNFNFQELKMSEHLWLYEGFVEYYSQYILLKNKIITDSMFIARIAEKRMKYKMLQSMQLPLDLANFSKLTYKNNKLSIFYSLGFINALNLDILIRNESNMKSNLFSIIKEEYLQSKSFNSDSLFRNISKHIDNNKVLDFATRYVYGSKYPDYEYYLSMIGLSYLKTRKQQGFYFPITEVKMTKNNTAIIKFSNKYAGIQQKEIEIIKINGQYLNSKVFSLIYKKHFKETTELTLTVIESDSINKTLIIEPMIISIPEVPYYDSFIQNNTMTEKQKKMYNEYFNKNIL